MILIEEVSRNWEREGEWRIAPAGLAWIAVGHRIIIGDGASIGNGARIGDGASIGNGARIGNGASIGNGARIGNYASIGDDASIGNYARIGDGARIGNGASIGNGARIGDGASIGNGARIGDGARIGNGASEAIDLGFADGFRKCIANVKGVAYIGAGCRWFTLDEAIKHWESHDKNRDLTLCLMQSAIHIAGLKGWAFSDDDQ